MSDSGDRDRRRVGDATRQRIDHLADGWKVRESKDKPADDPDAASPEDEPASRPPPSPRPKRPSKPPPPPPRSKRASAPPPAPKGARKSPPPPPGAKKKAPLPTPDGATKAPAKAKPLPPPPSRPPRPPTPPSAPEQDNDTVPVEREDPTRLEDPVDKPAVKRATGSTSSLRRPSVLPRKRGLLGDVRYVFTALFGVTEARRELAAVREQIEGEREGKESRLMDTARQTIADPSIELATVEAARETLAEIADVRSRHAGQVAASEAEIASLERNRSDESARHVEEVAALEAEVAEISARLEPLEARAVAARKKAAELHGTLAGLDKKIAEQKNSLVSVRGPAGDAATVEATLASLRADREGVASEEPAIAEELDDIEPKIASLTSSREQAEKRIDEIRAGEEEAVVRTAERIDAVRAVRAVQDRSVQDADRQRDKALLELGEQLAVERPEPVAARLRAIDEHDISIATLERRAIELSELVEGVDKAKLTRGIAMIVLALGAVAAVIVLLMVLR